MRCCFISGSKEAEGRLYVQYRNPLAAAQRVHGRDRGCVVLLLLLNPGPLSSGMCPSQLPFGCFHEMISDTILEQIAEQTNRYLR